MPDNQPKIIKQEVTFGDFIFDGDFNDCWVIVTYSDGNKRRLQVSEVEARVLDKYFKWLNDK